MMKRAARNSGHDGRSATTSASTDAMSSDHRMSRTRPIRSDTGTATTRPTPNPAVATDTDRAASEGEIP